MTTTNAPRARCASALLVALVLATIVAGCRREQDAPQSPAPDTTTTTTATAQPPAATGEAPATAEPSPPAVAPSGLRTVRMEIGGQPFTLEIAATDEDRQRGLMERKSMPADAGMIFVFDREQFLSFWMKNTLIPLDILYLNNAGQIVTIAQMKPLDESGVPTRAPARYAIELNAGTARRLGVRVGDVLRIPPEARQTADR